MIRKTLLRISLVILTAITLSGCASVEVDAYRSETPALNMRRFFNGTVEGWGMFQDRSGKVIKRFHVVIDSKWEGDRGTLDERFTWSDGLQGGNVERRVWSLQDLGGGRFVGRAGDVVGEAEGVVSGNALRWRYVLALPVDGKTINVDFDDWMYLIDDQVMLNRSAMSKFGVHLGEVTLTLQRKSK